MTAVRTAVIGTVGGSPVTSHRGPTPASGAGPCEMDNQGAGYSERRSLRAKERGDGVDPSQEQVDPHASIAQRKSVGLRNQASGVRIPLGVLMWIGRQRSSILQIALPLGS